MMDMDLHRRNLRHELEAAIPETRDGSVAIVSFEPGENEPLHATVGIAFSERFVRHMFSDPPHPVTIGEYAAFLDRMISSEDPYVRDVATAGVLERVVGATPDTGIARVRNLLGPLAQVEFDRTLAMRWSRGGERRDTDGGR